MMRTLLKQHDRFNQILRRLPLGIHRGLLLEKIIDSLRRWLVACQLKLNLRQVSGLAQKI